MRNAVRQEKRILIIILGLDLQQVDVTRFLASGASFQAAKRPRERLGRERSSSRAILNRTKDVFESLVCLKQILNRVYNFVQACTDYKQGNTIPA